MPLTGLLYLNIESEFKIINLMLFIIHVTADLIQQLTLTFSVWEEFEASFGKSSAGTSLALIARVP